MDEHTSPEADVKIASDTGPFAMIPKWVIRSGLSTRALHLYVVLAEYADNSDGTAYPSRTTLADRLACSVKTVDRAVRELEDVGALVVRPQYRDGRQVCNTWVVVRTAPLGATDLSPRGDTSDAPGGTPVTPRGGHGCPPELDPVELDPVELLPTAAGPSFDEFWDAYPKRNGRKVGKAAAQRQWLKIPGADLPTVLIAVHHYAAGCGAFAKDPERFLKADYWRDWIDPPEPTADGRIRPRGFDAIERVLLGGEAS